MDNKKYTHLIRYKESTGTLIDYTSTNQTPTKVFQEVLITEEQMEILDILCDIRYDATGKKWHKLNEQLFEIGLNIKGDKKA